ncbi:hypothetical protein I4U23_028796 [Adineta vaga]|nr:hypothetical protein I4U23_028796 [Adineta vaga]
MGHGRMSYSLKNVRFILICVNVIIFLCGATLIGEGIDLLVTRRFHNFREFLFNIENEYPTNKKIYSDDSLYLLTIIPGLVFASIGFFGCSGVITQIQCLLFYYAWLIGILLTFQTIILISLITFRIQLKEKLVVSMKLFLQNEYTGPLEKNLQLFSFLWDYVMYHFKCCGIESKNDFDMNSKWSRTNPWWNQSMTMENKSFIYPLTCCPIDELFKKEKNSFSKLLSCAIDGNDIYEINCYEKFIEIFQSNEAILLTLILSMFMIEMMSLIFVLVIYNRNRLKQSYCILEERPPPYTPRTTTNNTNIYVQL